MLESVVQAARGPVRTRGVRRHLAGGAHGRAGQQRGHPVADRPRGHGGPGRRRAGHSRRCLPGAFRHATETAYRAVRRPVEGTMLTVLREMAEAAAAGVRAPPTRRHSWTQVVAAGWKSVERTPTLLRVLADAGVVDAGGYGLVVLVEGRRQRPRRSRQTAIATHVAQPAGARPAALSDEPEEEESEFTYCTSFLLTGQRARQGLARAGARPAGRQPAGGGRRQPDQGARAHRRAGHGARHRRGARAC